MSRVNQKPESLQIDYSGFSPTDRAYFKANDASPGDNFLSAKDLQNLPKDTYREVVHRARQYGYWEGKYNPTSADEEQITSEIKEKQTDMLDSIKESALAG